MRLCRGREAAGRRPRPHTERRGNPHAEAGEFPDGRAGRTGSGRGGVSPSLLSSDFPPPTMNRSLPFASSSLILAVLLVASGCMSSSGTTNDGDTVMGDDMETSADAGVMVGGAMMLPTQTLVENASEASTLTTLVAAVQAADLVETLSGPGPFTVFAPTNAAFGELPEGTVETLTQPANKGQLTSLLTYHVVPGRLSASDLSDGQTLTTVNGAQLRVTKQNGTVMVGGATVTQADVYASNGVAHVIDTVLMP